MGNENLNEFSLISQALDDGLDLREYSQKINGKLNKAEEDIVQAFLDNAEKTVQLHLKVKSCDSILERVESMLEGFQDNLGDLSREIRHLQDQSTSMGIKLNNRRSVREYLSQLVDELLIPEEMIEAICTAELNEQAFMEQLHQLNRKIRFIREQTYHDTEACKDVAQVVDNLRLKSSNRIRTFLFEKIYQFRKPLANYHIPQNTMLRFRFFYEFLLANERPTAQEIKDEYLDTVSKVYYSYFRSYLQRLMKLKFSETATKLDMLGNIQTTNTISKGLSSFNPFASKPVQLKQKETIFTLGNRNVVIESELESSPIVPHAERIQEQLHSFESLFRSIHYALLDSACREYLFICDFFLPSEQAKITMFNMIFSQILQTLISHLETYLTDCWDSIALFLCIHIILKYQIIAHQRDVPVLDNFYQQILNLLWPRMELVCKANIQSVRNCEVEKLGKLDLRPHIITRRYAEFCAAIGGLNENYPETRIENILDELSAEVELCVSRMASIFPHPQSKLIFLINNYDMLLGVLSLNKKDDASNSVFRFEAALTAVETEFVSLSVQSFLGDMKASVKSLESGKTLSESSLVQTTKKFNQNWKTEIDTLNRDCIQSFSNFKCGTRIIQAALTELLETYAAFYNLVTRKNYPQLRQELINVQKLMVDVKEKRPQF